MGFLNVLSCTGFNHTVFLSNENPIKLDIAVCCSTDWPDYSIKKPLVQSQLMHQCHFCVFDDSIIIPSTVRPLDLPTLNRVPEGNPGRRRGLLWSGFAERDTLTVGKQLAVSLVFAAAAVATHSFSSQVTFSHLVAISLRYQASFNVVGYGLDSFMKLKDFFLGSLVI